MEKTFFLARLLTIVMAVTMSFGFSSCSDDDDDDKGNVTLIVGTWIDTGDNSEVSFTFKKDGTGFYQDNSGTKNFNYTFDENNYKLKLWYVDSSTVYNYDVSLTGNTLMLTRSGSTFVLRRK